MNFHNVGASELARSYYTNEIMWEERDSHKNIGLF